MNEAVVQKRINQNESKNMNSLQTTLASLTPLEIKALRSAYASSHSNGHDFGFSDEVSVAGLNKKQVGALITNLLTKDVLERDEEFGQIWFSTGWSDLPATAGKHEVAQEIAKFLGLRGLDARELRFPPPAGPERLRQAGAITLQERKVSLMKTVRIKLQRCDRVIDSTRGPEYQDGQPEGDSSTRERMTIDGPSGTWPALKAIASQYWVDIDFLEESLPTEEGQ